MNEFLTSEEVVETSEQLSEAISAVLGFDVKMNLYIETSKSGNKAVYAKSERIHLNGVAMYMFKDLTIGSFGSVRVTEENSPNKTCLAWFELHASYNHQTSGSNGCNLGFAGARLVATLKREWDISETKNVWSISVFN